MKKHEGRFFNDYAEVTVLYKNKKQNKENVKDVINKAEHLLSKFLEQIRVSPLPPSPSMLITTGA